MEDPGSLIKLIALMVVVMTPLYFAFHYVWQAFWYATPRQFEFGDETYIWIPDPGPHGFFAKRYRSGSFEYADGTPVTDPHIVEHIGKEWRSRQRRWEQRERY